MFAALESGAQDSTGIKLTENTSISPFIEGSITYDNNVPLNPIGEEIEDLYIDLVPGLSFLWNPESASLNASAWYQIRRYFDFDNLNNETWQENIEFVYGERDKLQFIAKQRHGELSDYEFTQSEIGTQTERMESGQRLIETRTRRTERSLDDLEASLRREGRMILMYLSAHYAAVSFERSEYNLYDWSEMYISPRLGVKLSEKTMISLSGDLGKQDSDNQLDELEYLKARIGINMTPSDKTDLKLEGGFQEHKLKDNEESELNQTSLHFDVNGTWAMTRRTTLQLFGRNEFLPTSAFDENTKRVDQGSIGVAYDINQRAFTTAGISYRRDDYTAKVNGIDALEELLGFQLRLSIRNKDRNINIYGKGRYEIFTSNIQDNYNQLRLTLGASVAL